MNDVTSPGSCLTKTDQLLEVVTQEQHNSHSGIMVPWPRPLPWTSFRRHRQGSMTACTRNPVCYPIVHPPFHAIVTPFVVTRTQCERSSNFNNDESSTSYPEQQHDEPCDVCLYTGVATCFGLSLYFLKTAFLDLPESTSQSLSSMKEKVQSQKRFLLFLGSASAAAGVYRLYLG